MKVVYDSDIDALKLTLSNTVIVESDKDKSRTIMDYDGIRNLVGLKILNVSIRLNNTIKIG